MIKRLVLELDEEFHQEVKKKAVLENKSMRSIMLELLKKWLKRK